MPQSPHNAVIAPRAILLGEAHDQGLECWIDLGASKRLALLGTVKLLRDAFPMPYQNRLRLDDRSDFRQRLLS